MAVTKRIAAANSTAAVDTAWANPVRAQASGEAAGSEAATAVHTLSGTIATTWTWGNFGSDPIGDAQNTGPKMVDPAGIAGATLVVSQVTFTGRARRDTNSGQTAAADAFRIEPSKTGLTSQGTPYAALPGTVFALHTTVDQSAFYGSAIGAYTVAGQSGAVQARVVSIRAVANLTAFTTFFDYIVAEVTWALRVDKAGGAVAAAGAGGSKKVEKRVINPSGATSAASGGTPLLGRRVEKRSLTATGPTSAASAGTIANGRKVDKRSLTATGAASTAITGGARTTLASKPGGATIVPRAGATKMVTIDRGGGGVLLPSASAARKVAKVSTGGGLAEVSGGGPSKPLVSKVGGTVAVLTAGGARKTLASKLGGGVVTAAAGGPKKVVAVRLGGGIAAPAAGATRNVAVSRLGGGIAALSAGAPKKVTASRLGGGVATATSTAQRRVQRVAAGGGVLAGKSGALYGLYTFGLSGYTYDALGAAITGATVKIFRADTDEKVKTLTSGADARYSTTMTSEPVSYWIRAFKASAGGVGVDWFGTTDDDLVVQETLVQGTG